MTAFGPDQAAAMVARCQAASPSIAAAFSAAFSGIEVRTQDAKQFQSDDLPSDLAGAGLVLGLTVEQTPCCLLISQAGGLLPAWCATPDDAGRETLQRLGRDLAKALLPAEAASELGDVAYQDDLAVAIQEAKPSDDSVCFALEIAQGETSAQLWFVWPVGPEIAAESGEESAQAAGDATASAASQGASQPGAPVGKLPKHRRLIYRNLDEGIRQLPAYAQSLLRVQVPVTVTLASTKTAVSKVLDMGPGTILQFKKACDSNLTLEVGRQTVAEGEAVKVGDKFGLWITSMTMPGERFWSVNRNAPAKRVK